MKYLHLAVAAAATCWFPAAHAQYKCVGADGKTSFQQDPCSVGAQEEKLNLPSTVSAPSPAAAPAPSAGRNWAAIARGMPEVGMTAKDLLEAMGQPDKANLAQYGTNTHDQLIYYRGDRTLYVYVRNGVVTSIQNQAGGRIDMPEVPQRAKCPTPEQLKELEFDASRIGNRDNHAVQAELARARVCR